jgi:molybdenum cofactor biosynthesis enzyme
MGATVLVGPAQRTAMATLTHPNPAGDGPAKTLVAAIQAARRTWELIPLCHPRPLNDVAVSIEPAPEATGMRLQAMTLGPVRLLETTGGTPGPLAPSRRRPPPCLSDR